MFAWKYLTAGFWHRVPLPLLGRVPLNPTALTGFGIAGFDQPVFWAAGAVWEILWLGSTAGRARYRRAVDAAARRTAWRTIEERRFQLYNQLPPADQVRHHELRTSCQKLLAPRPGAPPEPAAELFTWLHLKLLLARQQAAGQLSPPDPDLPRLHAGAAVELTDPARSRLADEAVALLDSRQGLRDSTQPLLPQIDAALQRIEAALAAARSQCSPALPPDFTRLAEAASLETERLPATAPLGSTTEVDHMLLQLAKEDSSRDRQG